MKNLDIVYEDNSILIINKPAGLAVQGGSGIKTSLDKILEETFKTPSGSYPLLVHRLDKDTSGLILTAKTKQAAALYSGLLSGPLAKKQYIAVCSGHPQDQRTIDDDLDVKNKMKKSQTKFRVIKKGNTPVDFAVVELELCTGRMHQIRRHLAMMGNPVLGDDKYGDFSLNKKLKKTAGLKHLLLHASRLIIKGEIDLDICAPLPQYFNPFT